MKKRILNLFLALSLFIPCMLGLVACKDKTSSSEENSLSSITLSEADSLSSITSAISKIETKTIFEVTKDMGLIGKTVYAKNEEGSYGEIMGLKSWTRTEDGVTYQYSISSFEFNGEEITRYTKTEYDDNNDMGVSFDTSEYELSEDSTFVSGSVEGSKKIIVYSMVEDTQTMLIEYTIENDLITSILMKSEQGVYIAALTFKYDADVNIPPLPIQDSEENEIVWEESSGDDDIILDGDE